MSIFDSLFACKHKVYSWPRGRARKTYVVCRDCGKRIPYDFENMRIDLRLRAISHPKQTKGQVVAITKKEVV